MKIVKILLLFLGFYILFIAVRAVGWNVMAREIASLGWSFLPLLFVYPFIFAFNTLGWAYSFPRDLPKHVPWRDLYRIRIIGEAFNCVIPWAASLGGEPLKVELLKKRHGIPAADSYASVLIVHTTFWVSLNLFVLGGLFFTWKHFSLTPALRNSVAVFLAALALGAFFLFFGLRSGVFRHAHKLGDRLGWWGNESAKKKERFHALDEEIKKFYTADPRRFTLSCLFNFLGWLGGVVEVYWMAQLLNLPIGWREAWLLEALIQVLRIVTFFIPSSIGAQEGGIMLIFSQFGFQQSTGLTFAVIRRVREFFWIGVGLLLWSVMKEKSALKKN